MLELAEDEQIVFIEYMKKKSFEGKTPSNNPTFTALVGVPGSGKSTLAKNIENAVVVSQDDVIIEYARTFATDTSKDFWENDVRLFAAKVNVEIIKEAVKNKFDIVFDTAATDAQVKMIKHMQKKGYDVNAKVMLVDEYQAAMNVIERKHMADEQYALYEQGKSECPDVNLLRVKPETALNIANSVTDFIQEAVEKKFPMEIYEFGKKEPSFRTGDDFNKFVDNLELKPIEEHLERANNLLKKAKTKRDVLDINFLKSQMQSGR